MKRFLTRRETLLLCGGATLLPLKAYGETSTYSRSRVTTIYDDIMPVYDRSLPIDRPHSLYGCSELQQMRNYFAGLSTNDLLTDKNFNATYERVLAAYKSKEKELAKETALIKKRRLKAKTLAAQQRLFWDEWELWAGLAAMIGVPILMSALSPAAALVASGIVALSAAGNFYMQMHLVEGIEGQADLLLTFADARNGIFSVLAQSTKHSGLAAYTAVTGSVFQILGAGMLYHKWHKIGNDTEQLAYLKQTIKRTTSDFKKVKGVLDNTLKSKANYIQYLQEAAPAVAHSTEKLWVAMSHSDCVSENLVGISKYLGPNRNSRTVIRPSLY